ncbi:unnamed protein product [Trichobilharzia regenti]|nr:unnamed protein product [Trichobilharzia regenti]
MAWDADGDNLAIIDDKTKISLLGKHTRKITCAVWNRKNILALASEDKSITVNSVDGDLIKHVVIHDQPSDLEFGQMKVQDSSKTQENTVSCIVGKKQLFLLNLDDMDNPLELAFRQAYGDLIAYQWFGDGYLMVGFSNGYFVVVSTQSTEIGKEIYQIRDHKDGLHDISVSTVLNRCATVGDRCLPACPKPRKVRKAGKSFQSLSKLQCTGDTPVTEAERAAEIPSTATELPVDSNPPRKAEILNAAKLLKSGNSAEPNAIIPKALLTNPEISEDMLAHDITVKIHDLQNVRELTAIIELEEENNDELTNKSKHISNNLFQCQLQWSDDGQLMAISTPQKLLHVFLSQLPMLAALSPPNSTGLMARLTSLLEVTVEPIPCMKVSIRF